MTHECSACSGTGSAWHPVLCAIPCPVCLGAGQFSDRMPARDSAADADTLNLFRAQWLKDDYDSILLRAIQGLKYMHPRMLSLGRADDAVYYMTLAARAAFKACPGLRG